MNLSEANKQKVAEAIAVYVQAVESDPSIATCSMCGGKGELQIDEPIACPRCEGSGRHGSSFVIVLESEEK